MKYHANPNSALVVENPRMIFSGMNEDQRFLFEIEGRVEGVVASGGMHDVRRECVRRASTTLHCFVSLSDLMHLHFPCVLYAYIQPIDSVSDPSTVHQPSPHS